MTVRPLALLAFVAAGLAALPDLALAQATAPATETRGAMGMSGVGFIMAIVIGAIAGWLAEQFTKSNMGLLMNIVMGIIGALVGNFLFGILGIGVSGFIGNLISATIGAILVIVIYRAIAGRRSTTY
jgi:uncharacterized membrane protein YeaQ/YmgE (transglycosylase-associated protein family)